MRGTTHAAIGASIVWIPTLLGTTVAPWLIAVGALAALLPDLDASESKIKHLTVGGYFGKTRIGIKPFAPIAMILSAVFRHRGVLHSLVALTVIAVGAGVLIPRTLPGLWWMVFLGYLSHLLADALTKSGIELFWPMRIRVGLLPKAFRIKTSGFFDALILIIGSVGVVLWLYLFTGNSVNFLSF